MGEKMSLGQYISTRRRHMRLTQEELADKIGVSKSAIAKWETDGGLPDRDNLRRLAEVMEVSVDDLHRIIDQVGMKNVDFSVNITPEVISALESYGYKVIRPGEETD
jgi:transcriptional regulator with XRE-family HTH domain